MFPSTEMQDLKNLIKQKQMQSYKQELIKVHLTHSDKQLSYRDQTPPLLFQG